MIKNVLLFFISMALLIVGLCFAGHRLLFLSKAKKVTGSVIALKGDNSRCGSKRSRHNCTKFSAQIQFEAQSKSDTWDSGTTHSFWVSAGHSRGHNEPVSRASYRIGNTVPVVYNPSDPSDAFRDNSWDIWKTPLAVFFFQIATLFGSFSERRRYYG